MRGPVALVGAGEFLPVMTALDTELLAATGRSRPRVAIVPTASFPDGVPIFERWAAMGCEHFTALGAEVEAVLVRDRQDADDPAHAQAVGEADLIYFSGGKPAYLRDALVGSAVWGSAVAAHARGAVLVGCSAGAMVLVERLTVLRRGMLPWPVRWLPGLDVIHGAAVFPHYDRIPQAMAAMMALQAPRGVSVLGIDEDTAIVGRDGSWQVSGPGRVTIWRGRHRDRLRTGDVFRLVEAAPAG